MAELRALDANRKFVVLRSAIAKLVSRCDLEEVKVARNFPVEALRGGGRYPTNILVGLQTMLTISTEKLGDAALHQEWDGNPCSQCGRKRTPF